MKQLLKKLKSHSLKEMMREYQWLSRYSIHYKAEILWYILVGILGTGTSLLASILSKHIIDAVTGFNSHGIVVALLFFVLIAIVAADARNRHSAQVSSHAMMQNSFYVEMEYRAKEARAKRKYKGGGEKTYEQ